MPGYTDKDDLKNALSEIILIQLADDNADGAEDDPVVDQAIANAEADVDAALSTRFTVPLTGTKATIPQVVRYKTMWLSVCKLGSRRGILPEEYQKECEEAEQWLKDVKDGKVDIPGLGEIDTNLPTSTTQNQQREFVKTRFDLNGGELNEDENKTMDTI